MITAAKFVNIQMIVCIDDVFPFMDLSSIPNCSAVVMKCFDFFQQ